MPGRDRAGFALAAVLLLALAWGGAAPAAWAADQTLALEVVINGANTGKVGEFVLRGGALLARRAELDDLGLAVPEATAQTSDGLVVVSALPGVSFTLDTGAQLLRVTAAATGLKPTLLYVGRPAGFAPMQSSLGATLNYDLSDTAAEGRNVASGLFDLRVFSPWGIASTDLLAYAGHGQGLASSPSVRLDSTYVYSDVPHQRRYRLGDVITGGLTWTRPVRLGGVQVSQDFSMRPDLVTFPLPSVAGTAAVPSTVDVLLNGSKVLSGPVPAGPFHAPQLPVVTGAGVVTLTVTDALGRQVTATLPFYASSSLLAPGLHTASLEAGLVRRNWGVLSNDYGAMAGSATWRAGLTSHLTFEAHAEGTSGQLMAGAGLVANAFDFAVVNLAVAASDASGRSGVRVSFGAERQTSRLSFGVSAVISQSAFRDIAAMNGDPAPTRQIGANANLALGHWGALGVAYAQVDRAGVDVGASLGGAPSNRGLSGPQHQRVATGNYSVQVGRAFLYATVFEDFAQRHGARGATLGLTIPLGRRSSASVSANGGAAPHLQAQVEQSTSAMGDWGYQAFVGTGGTEHQFGEAQYKAPWALVSGGVDHLDGRATGRLEARGALSLIDNRLFASNLIDDSFAVVDTAGLGGVQVYYENRPVGRTDAGGRRLVPDLRAFDVNHLSIDPADLPPDAALAATSRDVRPPDRSGVVVTFPIRRNPAALLTLVDEAGRPLPVGSTAVLQPNGAAAPVGYDGQAYVEDLGPQNRIEAQLPNGDRCVATFAFRPVKGEIQKIGPLTCRAGPP